MKCLKREKIDLNDNLFIDFPSMNINMNEHQH